MITFAHTSFSWSNLAANQAGVTVVIVGISNQQTRERTLFSIDDSGKSVSKTVDHINAYLVAYEDVIVNKQSSPLSNSAVIQAGGKPVDGGNLFLGADEKRQLQAANASSNRLLMRAFGAEEYTNGKVRYCLWISDDQADDASRDATILSRTEAVAVARAKSPKLATRRGAAWPHRFEEVKQSGTEVVTIIPKLTSETREYIPAGLLPPGTIVTDLAFASYDAPPWVLSIIASKLHFVWIATVCGKFKKGYRYSNTLGWNTFPVPMLTEQNKIDLTRCAEEILLARESHFPATIAELYDPEKMPEDLRRAHDRNDLIIERIYIGRRFKNDTERLEKLFEMYTKMTSAREKPRAKARKR